MKKQWFLLLAVIGIFTACSPADLPSQPSAAGAMLPAAENIPSAESASKEGEKCSSSPYALNEESLPIDFGPENVRETHRRIYYDDSLFENKILPKTEAETKLIPPTSEGFYNPDDPRIDRTTAPDDVWQRYPDDQIVIFSELNFKPPPNIDLWNSWVNSFVSGEPAGVLLYGDGYGFPSVVYELIADGSEAYTVKVFTNNYQLQFKSTRITSNDFQQYFALDFYFWETKDIPFLYTRAIDLAVLDYDIKDGTTLGEVSPQEAIELGKQRLEELVKQFPDYEGPPKPNWRVRIIGAVSIFGHPCYVIKASSPQPDYIWDQEVAINADGGNLFFQRDTLHGKWWLKKDTEMKTISAKKKQN